jgi:hypothetical protein
VAEPLTTLLAMGYLLWIAWFAAVVWVWINFGVLFGVLAFIAGAVILQFVGPKVDERSSSRSNAEFDEAWKSIANPPLEANALSAKRRYVSRWRVERKQTGESAAEWLARVRAEERA